jgi:hypothetical protein
MTHEEGIAGLKIIVQNMYDKMNINIAHYEKDLKAGKPNLDELKQLSVR